MTSKPRVVLVDVDDTRRESFKRYLSARYEVHSFPLAGQALKALPELRPDALLTHAYQPGGSGPRLCASARALPSASRCLTLVYGRSRRPYGAPRGGPVAADLGQVDVRLDRRVDVVDVDKALAHALAQRRPARARPTPSRHAHQPVEVVSASRHEGGVWERYRGPDALIDRLPTRPDVGWDQILRARLTLHNLRVALGKHVTPLVDRLPSDRRPTFGELFRARASLYNVSVILGVGPGRSGPHQAAG